MNIDHPHILDILYIYYYVSNQRKIVNICWIPSHIGIHGNNEADCTVKIPSTHLKHFIKIFINSLWPIFWDFVIRENFTLFQIRQTNHVTSILNVQAMLLFPEFYRSFTINSFMYSKRWTATWMHFLLLPIDYSRYNFRVFRHLSITRLTFF